MTTARIEGLRSPAALAAAARSGVYSRLAAAFAFPERRLAGALTDGSLVEDFTANAAVLPFPLPLPVEVTSALVPPGGSPVELEAEYIRLFEAGAGRPPCPLYEGLLRGTRMKLMEDLIRFYQHFGLGHKAGDLPDHLSSELEFMHYLAFKEAAALHQGKEVAPYRRAQRDFLSRHLCRWLPRLVSRLAAADAWPFFQSLAAVTDEFCRRDLGYLAGPE